MGAIGISYSSPLEPCGLAGPPYVYINVPCIYIYMINLNKYIYIPMASISWKKVGCGTKKHFLSQHPEKKRILVPKTCCWRKSWFC